MRAPRLASVLANWTARGAVVLGGVALLNFLSPVPRGQEAIDGTAALGRGKPEIPPSIGARAAGHETGDLSGRNLAWLVAGLGGSAACVIALMVGLMGTFNHARDAARPAFSAQQIAVIAPPPPNLQAAPLSDIADLHRQEDRLLAHYAWIDPGHTRARIPVARAMALMVGRRLEDPP